MQLRLTSAIGVFLSITALRGSAEVAPPRGVGQPAGTTCPAVTVPAPDATANVFSPQQEAELGRIIESEQDLRLRVIEDPAVTGYLQQVGERLLSVLAPSGGKYRFSLIDLPSADALAGVGGRVLVSTKMVGLMRSEDDLAAVLAHEIGHGAYRHGVVGLSQAFRRGLKLERVDTIPIDALFDTYQQLIESPRTDPGRMRVEDVQADADALAIRMLFAAGYRPEALAAFFDRLVQLPRGRGNWLSDMLGLTPPEGKRLRALLDRTPTAPGCQPLPSIRAASEFQRWQQDVLRYRGVGRAPALPGLLQRTKLEPALRNGVRWIRTSPDGRHVFAQDASAIAVFTRERLGLLFQIDALEADAASFSPDGRRISLLKPQVGGSPRVEWWSVPDGGLTVHEVHVADACVQAALSPDGTALACVTIGENYNDDVTFDLRILSVDTQDALLERKGLVTLTGGQMVGRLLALQAVERLPVMHIGFSPDGQHLLVGNEKAAVGFDLRARRVIELPPSVKRLMRRPFAFMGDHRLVGGQPGELHIVGFPDGAPVVEAIPVGNAAPAPTTDGDYLLLSPLKGGQRGVMDVRTRKIVLAFPMRAADVIGGFLVREREDGSMAVQKLSDGSEIVTATMPESPIAGLRAGAMSPDGRWLAVSGSARGAVWDLETRQRVLHVMPFDTAWLGERDAMHAIVRERDVATPSIVRFDLLNTRSARSREVDTRPGWIHAGPVILSFGPVLPGEPAMTFRALDVDTGAERWRRALSHDAIKYPDPDRRTLTLAWPLAEKDVRQSFQRDPEWQSALRRFTDLGRVVACEVIDLGTGATLGRVAVDASTPSRWFRIVAASSDRVYLQDGRGRVLVYGFDGEVKLRMFASSVTPSLDGRRMAVGTAQGRLVVLDASTRAKIAQLQFMSPVLLTTFSPDARVLRVLTADQTEYTFDVDR